MKKFISITLAIALILSLSVPAFASSERRTDFTLNYVAQPTFLVSIPADMDLKVGYNPMNVTLSRVENLGEDKVVVYLADSGAGQASGLDNPAYVFQLRREMSDDWVRYHLYNDYEVTHDPSRGDNAIGKELLVLDEANNAKFLYFRIFPEAIEGKTPGDYNGYVTYGITLKSVYDTMKF